jgi:hypothetical protein
MKKQTVFIHTEDGDPHAESVAQCLRNLDVPVETLPREKCFLDWTIECVDDDVWLVTRDRSWHHSRIASIYWRRDYLTEPAWVNRPDLSREEAAFIADQRSMHIESAFKKLALKRPFLNDINANRLASSKALQHHVARQCGLPVPCTFIGSDRKQAHDFAQRLWRENRRCCTKNLESVHVFINGEAQARLTQLFEPDEIGNLEGLSICPMIFQEYVEKACEYRATVVGNMLAASTLRQRAAIPRSIGGIIIYLRRPTSRWSCPLSSTRSW